MTLVCERQKFITPDGLDPERQLVYSILDTIPAYDSYLSSQEIDLRFHDLARTYSRDAAIDIEYKTILTSSVQDIKALFIAPGDLSPEERRALVPIFLKGNVHTNEIMWTRTFDFLPQFLCTNPDILRRLNARFIFLDADPGGTDLNGPELVRGDITIDSYPENAVRSHRQVDWDHTYSEPGHNHISTLPGTQASEHIINRHHPDLVVALHNSALGNVFTYVTRSSTTLCKDLSQLPENIWNNYVPGVPDAPWVPRLAPGIYAGLDAYQTSKYLRENTETPKPWSGGTSVVGYHADRVDGLGMVTEAPYLVTKALAEQHSAGMTLAQATRMLRPETQQIVDTTEEILQKADWLQMSKNNRRLYEATKHIVGLIRKNRLEPKIIDTSDDYITRGDLNGKFIELLFYPAGTLGQAARLADATGNSKLAAIARHKITQVTTALKEQLKEITTSTRQEQVAQQVGPILLGLLAVKEKKLGRNVIRA